MSGIRFVLLLFALFLILSGAAFANAPAIVLGIFLAAAAILWKSQAKEKAPERIQSPATYYPAENDEAKEEDNEERRLEEYEEERPDYPEDPDYPDPEDADLIEFDLDEA